MNIKSWEKEILIYFCCFIYISSARNDGRTFKAVPCISAVTVTSYTSSSKVVCAGICLTDNQNAFAFNSKTGECQVLNESISESLTCGTNDVRIYKFNECKVRVPAGYTLEYPYSVITALARYRCVSMTDQSPVNHCPLVKCNAENVPSAAPTSCSVKDVFDRNIPEYHGRVTCTVKGVLCQRWDSSYPHEPRFFVGRSDLENWCQLYSGTRPWCYTTDPAERWDFCPVEEIYCGVPSNLKSVSSATQVKTKLVWPHLSSTSLGLYRCASFTPDDPVTSCPVTYCYSNLTWSKAIVSCSVKDCYSIISKSYDGRVSCTETGFPCMRWDSPHVHETNPFPGRSDLANWCQMTDDSPRPWCYTDTGYEYCPVEPCNRNGEPDKDFR